MRMMLLLLTFFTTLLTGCASTIKSEVTAFHEWPKDFGSPSFVFAHTEEQAKDLAHRNVENLIRKELIRVGLREPADKENPQLKVLFSSLITGRDVHVIQTVLVDSWYGTPWYGPGYHYPYWVGSGWGHPYYGTMWPSMPVAREVERRYTVFHRELKIKIIDLTSDRAIYDVTVSSDGKEGNLATVMPYLVQSAFTKFPGESGVPHVIKLKFSK